MISTNNYNKYSNSIGWIRKGTSNFALPPVFSLPFGIGETLPQVNSDDVGYCFFYIKDGNSKPVWWNGVKWIDATGADV